MQNHMPSEQTLKRREYYRNYYQRNKDRLKEQRRSEEYKAKRREYFRQYRENNRVRITEATDKWRGDNPGYRVKHDRKYKTVKRAEYNQIKESIGQGWRIKIWTQGMILR